jgi:hypothetical protein
MLDVVDVAGELRAHPTASDEVVGAQQDTRNPAVDPKNSTWDLS